MKGLRRFGIASVLFCLVLPSAGCGISEEEHGKTLTELKEARSELERTRDELGRVKFDLDKRTIELKQSEKTISETEKVLAGVRNELQEVIARHKKERLALQAPLVGISQEATFLRQKVAELTYGLQSKESEIGIIRKANDSLKAQTDALATDNDRLRDLLETQKARFAELERQLKAFQDAGGKFKIDLLK